MLNTRGTLLILTHDPAWGELLCDYFRLHGFSVLKERRALTSDEQTESDLTISDIPATPERPLLFFTSGLIANEFPDSMTRVLSKTTPLAQVLSAVEETIPSRKR